MRKRNVVRTLGFALGGCSLMLTFQGCGADGVSSYEDVGQVKQAQCPSWPPPQPNGSFCSETCPCDHGQGDCDSDAECVPGARCGTNNGPDFGYPSTYDMCVSCPAWPPASPDPDFCSEACPCSHGQGDCDSDAECVAGTTCVNDNGPDFGYPSTYDMCVCPAFDIGNPDANFCSPTCPCSEGQGGCSDDSDCASGLECVPNQGAEWGLPGNFGVCEQPSNCPNFNPGNPDPAFCSALCPCSSGEGDCDSNAECEFGLVCTDNVGTTFGLPATYDVCLAPQCGVFDNQNPDPDFCSTGCPCEAGEGDCDSDSECTAGTVCVDNVGANYGLPANYDVCEVDLGCPAFDPENPNPAFCSAACPCGEGEGDCDSDSECAGDAVCVDNAGATYGLPATWDVCLGGTSGCPAFDVENPNPAFCTVACPCNAGEGDCDRDEECVDGTVCNNNRGADYGLPATWSVCEPAPL